MRSSSRRCSTNSFKKLYIFKGKNINMTFSLSFFTIVLLCKYGNQHSTLFYYNTKQKFLCFSQSSCHCKKRICFWSRVINHDKIIILFYFNNFIPYFALFKCKRLTINILSMTRNIYFRQSIVQ